MIKRVFKEYSNVIKNFSHLTIIQLFTVIVPFITIPYLIKVLGAENYGLLAFIQSIMLYFSIFISFGFNLIGTKEVSINENNFNKINEIVSCVYIIRGSIFLLVLLFILIFNSIYSIEYIELYFLSMGICLNEFLYPKFYFQGIEKLNKVIPFIAINKLFYLLAVFFFVKDSNDILYVPFFNLIGVILANSLALIALRKNGVKIKLYPLETILRYFKLSKVMTLAYTSDSVKNTFSVLLIKNIFSYEVVGFYDLAQKIIQFFVSFLELISQSIFPKMTKEKNHIFFNKTLVFSFFVSILVICLLYFFGERIIFFIGGEDMQPAYDILVVYMFFVPLFLIGALLGRNGLIVYGFDKYVLRGMIGSSLMYLLAILISFKLDIKLTTINVVQFLLVSVFLETLYRFYKCLKLDIVKI